MPGSPALAAATLAATLIVLAALADHYRRRRRPSSLSWLLGLTSYAVGIAVQVLAEVGLFGTALYRLWYLAGAFYAAAYLGLGSLLLVLRGRAASWTTRGLVWASMLVAPIVTTAPVELSRVDPRLLSGEGFPQYVRLLTPAFNVFGTVGLVGVALWSAWGMRHGGSPWRLASVTAIAAGALVIAFGGTLLRFGIPGGFYLSQLAAIVLIGLGFGAGFRAARPRE